MIVLPPISEVLAIIDRAGLGDLATEIHQAIETNRLGTDEAIIDRSGDRVASPVISLEKQVRITLSFLKDQLIDPVGRMLEAEKLAAKLGGDEKSGFQFAEPSVDGYRTLPARFVYNPDDARRLEALLPRLEAALLASGDGR